MNRRRLLQGGLAAAGGLAGLGVAARLAERYGLLPPDSVDGLVERPASFSLAELRGWPSRSQITLLACEEGWSYVAQWTGVPLAAVLDRVGARPEARFVVYSSMQPDWRDGIDMADARHPQTCLAYGFNGGQLPVEFGGPLRMRVPRQLGYKSVKLVNRLTLTASLEGLSFGGYSWHAGI